MALSPRTRSRALVGLRHALAAAGLGLGWLLLSGPMASASGDLLGGESLLGSPSVSSVLEPVTEVAAPAPSLLAEGAAVVQGTTTTLADAVEALPPLVEPVLTGPLEPLAPVVDDAASGVGDAVTTVGDVLGGTVSTPVPVPGPLPLPVPGPGLPPAPTPMPGAVPDAGPAVGAAPTEAASGSAAGGPTSGEASTVDPASALRAMTAWALSGPASAMTVAVAPLPAGGGTPGGAPGDVWAFPLFNESLWLGSGTAGTSGGGPMSLALLSAALLLPPLLLAHARRLRFGGAVPPSPAFDPGSTPD